MPASAVVILGDHVRWQSRRVAIGEPMVVPRIGKLHGNLIMQDAPLPVVNNKSENK